MVPGESTQAVPIPGMYPSAGDEPRALCIVRDLSGGPGSCHKVTVNLPASTTAAQLMEEVGKKFHYSPDSFELVSQRMSDKEPMSLSELGEQTLEELGFRCDDNSRNNLIISEKNGKMPQKMEANSAEMNDISDEVPFGGSYSSSSTYVPPPAPPPYTPGSADFSYNYNYSQTGVRQDTGFVGLVNQAMTCYLNSLLQTLYMTPEFRNALYRWEFDGTEEEGAKSIPFQLQKLFLLLQTSKKPAVGTTELTTSFGWDSSEAWQQHDVQELCRVMFDALEQKFKNTDQSDLISKHYEGKLKDYVKCLECGYESAREDTFLDVPLVVRPFGSSQAYGSVEEALHAFVAPETLEGSNQYFCEQCSKKCDAHKGLKFTKFPYLLTLQLKRFDFDPLTMHRIKLNDKVTFPEVLNLNEFMKTEPAEEACDDGDATDSGSALDDESVYYSTGVKTCCSLSPEGNSDSSDIVDDDEGIDVGPSNQSSTGHGHTSLNDQNSKKCGMKGPYIYELFSIMVHSGSANGGHYYAYIKSFKDGEWYCFNDAQVTRITYDDIQKTYGGGPSRGYYSSAYSSSTNAYMLMYRQIDKEKNAQYMVPQEFPEHIKVLLQCMVEQEERERQQRELDRNMCKIKLFGPHPTQRRLLEYRLKIHKDSTLLEATATAQKLLGYEGIVPLDCCRLVKYDDFHDSLECSFENSDDVTMGELLDGVKSTYKFDLLLEIKKPSEKFEVYKPGGTTVKVYVVDLERGEVSPFCSTVRSNLCDVVQEFKNKIAQTLGIQSGILRVALEVYNNDVKLLSNPSKTLSSEGFLRSNKVYVEHSDVADAEKPFEESKFYKILDQHAHTICIHVGLPKVDKGILERLKIHENDVQDSKDDSGSEGENEDATSAPDAGFSEKIAEDVQMNSVYQNDSKKARTSSDSTWLRIKTAYNTYTTEIPKKTQTSVTPDDSSQDCDEGLGDSEVGDSCFTNGFQSNQTVHSDQSEDSSLTDSERTLVGDELSPRNNSPDIMGSEIDQDFESPQHASADILKPECDSMQHVSDMACSINESSEDHRNLSSPEENTKAAKCSSCMKLHTNDASLPSTQAGECPFQEEVVKRYFRAWPYTDFETGEKMLRVYLDKRISLAAVKKELEQYIGVGTDCFKIYKIYSNNQEFECTRLNENLMSFTEDTRLTVKLGRALRKGEYKVKIYQLCVSDPEPCKFLIDWVFVKGMTVLTAKKEILPEIKEKVGLDIPLPRCRLRKKNWKTPGTIFLDGQRFEKDIPITANWEVFLEILPEPETVIYPWQISIFTRQWHPDKYQIDPFREVVVENSSTEGLKSKISEISGIPEDCIEFAKGPGAFPCETSLLSIHKELDWHSQQSSLNTWPLCILDDGCVLYYRDKRIEPKRLTEEEKREIMNKENARSNKVRKTSYSPRKEKALKIYTLDSSPNSTCNSASISENRKPIVPDLD